MKANSGSKPPSGKKDAKKAKEAASKDSNNSNLLAPKYELDDNEDWSYPKWANAPRVGFGDRFELFVFRFITWVPVIITFCIFGFLFGFYLFCFLLPCLNGDMNGKSAQRSTPTQSVCIRLLRPFLTELSILSKVSQQSRIREGLVSMWTIALAASGCPSCSSKDSVGNSSGISN